jgi:hypothetical protein
MAYPDNSVDWIFHTLSLNHNSLQLCFEQKIAVCSLDFSRKVFDLVQP